MMLKQEEEENIVYQTAELNTSYIPAKIVTKLTKYANRSIIVSIIFTSTYVVSTTLERLRSIHALT